MPELPEVETIRRELEPLLAGKRITSVRVGRPDIVGFPGATAFARSVPGHTVRRLGRRGKYLIVELDKGRELVFHLRLSGHLAVNREPGARFERCRLELADGSGLSFVEPRVLGKVYFVRAGDYPKALAGMQRMGREPVEPGFDERYLADRLRGRSAPVKTLLLDQRVCCGVGNIYADEGLHRAGIRPDRRAGSLKPAEVRRLARGLRRVIGDGIRWCGTTLGDGRYLRPGSQAGSFQRHLRVMGREGETCRCGGRVKRIKLGNRSSHFCPRCQH